MADENLNTNENEETAALFVSAQKKKKAEEEAKRKEAEEQAKREAAEAEIRRMEEEVEERKRKAEEEKKALEEAEAAKAAAAAEKPQVKETVNKVVEKATEKATEMKSSGKLPLPMPALIGIAAAVVVLIIVLVVALGGKGGKGVDNSAILAADFKAEYTVKADGFGIKLNYPEEFFPSVAEEADDESVSLTFEAAAKKGTAVDVLVAPMAGSDGSVTRSTIALLPPNEMVKSLSAVKDIFNESESMTVGEVKTTDLSAEVPGRYYSSATFTDASGNNGAYYVWLKPGANDVFMMVTAMCKGKGEAADYLALCEKFADENAADALMVPGAKPPTSTEIDGMLTIDAMHMGIHMPSGQYFRCSELDGDGVNVFCDDNGALIIVNYEETDVSFDTADMIRDDIYDAYKRTAESGINQFYPYVDGRMFLDDAQNSMNHYEYFANYKDTIGGINYWEGFYACHWRDLRTNKFYFYQIITLAPELNKDAYYNLFLKALDRLDDI